MEEIYDVLRIRKLTDYGIVLLSYLAGDHGEQPHTARELATASHLPLPVVSKLLKLLAREGLLVSHRGAKGGYTLARAAEELSVAEIIAALEGPIAVTECGLGSGVCSQEPNCRVRDPWQHINRTLKQALGRVRLTDLAQTAFSLPLAREETFATDFIHAPAPQAQGKTRP